jgi:hypothetical protein
MALSLAPGSCDPGERWSRDSPQPAHETNATPASQELKIAFIERALP